MARTLYIGRHGAVTLPPRSAFANLDVRADHRLAEAAALFAKMNAARVAAGLPEMTR